MIDETQFSDLRVENSASLGASGTENYHCQALIAKLRELGVAITNTDIPELLRVGADAYFMRRQVDIALKYMDAIYIILNTMRR